MMDKPARDPQYFEIRLKGHLEARWGDPFEGMTITLEESGNTLLSGSVADQAALHGLLKKVRDLGLPLISVNPVMPGTQEAFQTYPQRIRSKSRSKQVNRIHSNQETEMKTLQQFGGIAALYEAAAYIAGMIGFLAVVNVSSVADPVQQVALMADNLTFLYTMHLFIYVVWGVFMVVLTLALYERLKTGSPAIAQTATVFGLFWGCVIMIAGMIHNVGMQTAVELYGKDPAQAGIVWLTIRSVFEGFAGANEAIGGIWILLSSWAALRTGALSRALNLLGIVVGVAGILSIVPALAGLFIYIFALGQIIWFIWLGIVLLRGNLRQMP